MALKYFKLDDLTVVKPIYSPVCTFCMHNRLGNGLLVCNAFPKGIPDVILTGDNKHTEPLPQQENDIVFERIPEEETQ